VLIKKIDAVGAQSLEHAFDGQLDMFGTAVEFRTTLAGLRVDVPAELRCDADLARAPARLCTKAESWAGLRFEPPGNTAGRLLQVAEVHEVPVGK